MKAALDHLCQGFFQVSQVISYCGIQRDEQKEPPTASRCFYLTSKGKLCGTVFPHRFCISLIFSLTATEGSRLNCFSHKGWAYLQVRKCGLCSTHRGGHRQGACMVHAHFLPDVSPGMETHVVSHGMAFERSERLLLYLVSEDSLRRVRQVSYVRLHSKQ